jgi:hypothetical protein
MIWVGHLIQRRRGENVSEASTFLTRMLDVLCDGGGRIAFAHDSRSMTYRETFERLRRLHGMLQAEGIAPGQLVAIIGGNAPERILLQIAAQLRGARVVHAGSPDALGDLRPDHIISADPEGPLLSARTDPLTGAVDEVDIARVQWRRSSPRTVRWCHSAKRTSNSPGKAGPIRVARSGCC